MTRVWGDGYVPHLDQISTEFVVSMPVESGHFRLDVKFPVSQAAAAAIQTDPVRIWLLWAGVHVLAHAAQSAKTWPTFIEGLPDLAETILLHPLQTAIEQLRAIDAAHPRANVRYILGLLSQGAVTIDDAWKVSGSAFSAG